MLKSLMLAISVSLMAVACGGAPAEETKTADDAKKAEPAADAPKDGAATPAADPAKPAADAPKPADATVAPK